MYSSGAKKISNPNYNLSIFNSKKNPKIDILIKHTCKYILYYFENKKTHVRI